MTPVGKTLIAAKAGVSVSTVDNWSTRDDWPEPRGHLGVPTSGPGSMPYWDWHDVEAFLVRNPTLGKR